MALIEKTSRDADRRFWDVAVRDHGKCVYCGMDGSRDVRILSNLHLDHLIPKRALGSDHHDNLVLCCPQCNNTKGQYDPSEGADLPPREVLIEKARKYIETQCGPYYTDLCGAVNSK